MRHAIRFLPAFLALLVPLAALAFLGSAELSRQNQRAETALRERALDSLRVAVQRFDLELGRCTAGLLEPDLDLRTDCVAAAGRALRAQHPLLAELLLLERDGDPVHPRPGLPAARSPPLVQPAREVRIADSLLIQGDVQGAIEQLEAFLGADGGRDDVRSRSQAWLQLGGAYRRSGELAKAEQTFRRVEAELGQLRAQGERPLRRRLRQGPAAELAAIALVARVACAELAAELRGDRAPALRLLHDLADGEYPEAADGLLIALLDRATAAAAPDAGSEVAEARRGVMDLIAGRQHARDYQLLAQGHLRARLASAGAEDRLLWVYDPGLGTRLLAIRPLRSAEREAYPGAFVAFVIDLTALVAQLATQWASSEPDSFHIDVLAPDGTRVLHTKKPEGADDWGGDVLVRSAHAGLQLQAIPRNAREQIESRRTSARNRGLLVVVLCLIAGGGALLLVRSTGRAAELAQLKVDLVSRVSHELRTPLSMIKMYGDTLALGRTSSAEQTARFAGIISREADRLTMMIDRILDFSQQQAGRMAYHPREADLGQLVTAVTEEYRPHVEAAGASLACTVEADLLARVDSEAMHAAVVNLLENAVKYTPRDAANRTVEVLLRRADGAAVLDVLDHGLGVPDAERTKIFAGFYRASNAGDIRGAGLGLSLVQHFARAHGGSVVTLPREGGGSVFRLTLPLLGAVAEPEPEVKGAAATARPAEP